MGRNRFVRFYYATFSRPGNQPFNDEPDAKLMWPFTARPADLFYYRFHEARISGFGPFFSGALLVAFGLGIWLLFQPSRARWVAALAGSTVVASLLVSVHLWWPRYGPQLWLLPILPVVFLFWKARPGWALRVAWMLVALLLINAGVVAVVRMTWETKSTIALRRQLTELASSDREIGINFRWFEVPVSERLKTWGISYQKMKRKELTNAVELMSVVEGYPGAVKYRVLTNSNESLNR